MCCVARIHALAVDARRLCRTIAVVATQNVKQPAFAVLICDESGRAAAFWSMIVHTAHFARFAGGKLFARILAFAVDARLIGRTLGVASAAEHRARDIRIATVAGRTLAHGVVVDAEAFGALAARAAIGSAGGHALTIDARVRAGAFVVRSTSDADALDLGIAIVALLARAHRFVVFDSALGVRSTVARSAADVVDARLVRRAIGVRDAAADAYDRFQWLARAAAAAHVALGADANHRAHWQRWHHFAAGRQLAWFERRARIDALVVDAR